MGSSGVLPDAELTDSELDAKLAGLRYACDSEPGIRRKRSGSGFAYFRESGERVTDRRTLDRIKKLVIPPAWTDVWICQMAQGHIQATGRDQRGRKQAIYHPQWRSHRDVKKFERLREFGLALPRIRKRVEEDLRARGLPKSKIVALVVRLLETTLIRVGNDRYAIENGSRGLTTLTSKNLTTSTGTVRFLFQGKSGVKHQVEYTDRRVARIIRLCQDLPGQALFQYLDESGVVGRVTSTDVNEYLQEAAQTAFTAKDFRTWAGTIEALRLMRNAPVGDTASVPRVVREVAKRLGNTPAVCRSAYIHPSLLESYAKPPKWLTARLPRPTKAYPDPVERLAIETLLG